MVVNGGDVCVCVCVCVGGGGGGGGQVFRVIFLMCMTCVTADRHRILLSGEYPDYIHAVSANVSNTNNSATAFIMVAVTVYRDTSRRRLTS